jgi:hypothetical protein
MYEMCITSVRPFPTEKGCYTYIIVNIDIFTRYVTLYRSVDMTTKAKGEALFNHRCT